MLSQDEQFMELALSEAARGLGRTSPNPAVGAVLVRDGVVVGKGYHHRAGDPHAEVNAIADAGPAARNATLYVTLEPCNHTGRTPPCTKAILDAGIQRVFVGMADPNPGVSGGGMRYLQEQGVEIHFPVLEERCQRLNYPFIKHSSTGLPWMVMKAGMSLDGKIAYMPGAGGSITGEASHRVVHELRNRYDAILVGIGTVLVDDPRLTVRLASPEAGRDPLRIVLDTDLRLPTAAQLLNQHSSAATWIFCGPNASREREAAIAARGGKVWRIPLDQERRLDLGAMMTILGESGVSSVLIEGGAAVHASMLQQGLVDEVYLFVAPFFVGASGVSLLGDIGKRNKKDCPGLTQWQVDRLEDDYLVRGLLAQSKND